MNEDYGPGVVAAMRDATRIHDVEQARVGALREHAHRYPHEIVNVMGFAYRRMTGAEVSGAFAAYEALPATGDGWRDDATGLISGGLVTDDGPGRDQHGSHDGPTVAQRLAEGAAEMTGPVVSVEHVGLPSPDFSAISASTEPRLYTDRLTLHADDLDVPAVGPRWQVLDAKDETTWHDLDAIVECEDPNCPIAATLPSDVECIVLVGTAWGDGFAHTPADAMIDVRIPAVTR